jgi:hypothetical protein
MVNKIALMTLFIIVALLLFTSVVVIAKGPSKKLHQGPNVKTLKGHVALIEKNPSNWVSTWMGQK